MNNANESTINRPRTSPVDILVFQYMIPLDMRVSDIADILGESFNETLCILQGEIELDSNHIERIASRFNTTTQLWVNLKNNYKGDVSK